MTELGRTRSERIQMIARFNHIYLNQIQAVKMHQANGQGMLAIEANIRAYTAEQCANVLKWTLTESSRESKGSDR